MRIPPVNLNSFWASLLVEELVRNGVDYFCLAPGSRSTPLTVAIAEHPGTRKTVHHDERGMAFHALGYGRATGKAAAVVTTSGTAVANLFPAVVEAAMERIPLLLLTADRPPELRDTAANQTIDQVKIFGHAVRWFVDLPCPDQNIAPVVVLTTVDQAVYRSRWPIAGPVHVNCMFREPLAPDPSLDAPHNATAHLDAWLAGKDPYTEQGAPVRTPHPGNVASILKQLDTTERGLIVVGGLHNQTQGSAVSGLAERLGWPICADVTSGLRLGNSAGAVIGCHDILVRDQAFASTHRPEVILHLGGRLVSKHLSAFLSTSKPRHYILVADHPVRQDPGHELTDRIEGDLALFCDDLGGQVHRRTSSAWLASWQENARAVHQVLARFAEQGQDLNEPVVAFLLSRNIPEQHALFLANSMPVRDMEMFACSEGPRVFVGANRGASGIDGTLAAAAGFAAGFERPATLLTGDLALLHDLNSLNYLRLQKDPVVVVVLNNDGGGIFSFLPIARFEHIFERYFATPHGLIFEKAAQMYGLSYHHPDTRQAFLACYRQAVDSGTSAIVEVTIDRQQNPTIHHRLIAEAHQALKR